MCSLLLAVGWSGAAAQGSPAAGPLERLTLTLVDNTSEYVAASEHNLYTNTLRLGQPGEPYKLSGGLLNEGDNFITVTRQSDLDATATEVARVNLNTTKTVREAEILTDIEFTSTTVPDGWTGNGLQANTSGNGYRLRSGSSYYLRYTIPQGYDGGTIILNIGTYTAGYFKINGSTTRQTTAGSWNQYILTGLNSGSTITIQGATSTGANGSSPYMAGIYIVWAPSTIVPTVGVTPTISYKNGNDWGAPQPWGSAVTYSSPNDVISLDGGTTITDTFTASTVGDQHPTGYDYTAQLDANIMWSNMSGDFYASVDFTKGDGDDMATSEYIGPNHWDYLLVGYYTPSSTGVPALYLDETSDFIYIMPPTFAGSTVNVTVTSTTGTDGAGNLVVNGESQAFTAGASRTWTCNVAAGGVIQFSMASGDDYTCDIAKIVIQGGNGTAMSAPQGQPASASRHQLALKGGKTASVARRALSCKK